MDDIQSQRDTRRSGEVERRAKMRFPFARRARFVVYGSSRVAAGQTVDFSSSGALIASDQQVRVGEIIELFVDWPVMLNGAAPLQLAAVGVVVRAEAGIFALSLKRYEIRVTKK